MQTTSSCRVTVATENPESESDSSKDIAGLSAYASSSAIKYSGVWKDHGRSSNITENSGRR